MKSEKQASLSSVLLAARKAALREETAEGAGAAPNLRVVHAAPEAVEEPAPLPPPLPAAEFRQDLMASKGAASAAGFRPAYWTYERSGESAAPGDERLEPQASNDGAASFDAAPAPDARLVAKRRMQWAVIGFGAVVLVVSTSSLLNMGSTPVVRPAPTPPEVGAPPVAVAPPVRQAMPVPVTPPISAPAPVVAAKPAVAAPAVTQLAPLQIAPVQIAPPAKPEVAAAPPPQTPAAAAPTDGEDMLLRGIAALETGDIASARLYLERAATVSDPHAALLLGQSYDPAFLKRIGAMGVRGDAAQAAAWYRKALALGEPTAQSHLDGLAVK